MSTFVIVLLSLYVGGALGFLLNVWCPTYRRNNEMQVGLHMIIWPFLGLSLVAMYCWMRWHQKEQPGAGPKPP